MRFKEYLKEVARGGEYDWILEPGADEFNPGQGHGRDEEPEYGSWARQPKQGQSMVMTRNGVPFKKFIARKVGKHAIEVIDDEGKHQLYPHTGDIDYKSVHTGQSRSLGSDVKESYLGEVQTGTGLGGTGATMPPAPGPSELEFDMDRARDEMRGKDTKAEAKTSKKKKERLKQYLIRRMKGELA